MSDPSPMVDIRALTKRFGGFAAVDNVDLAIRAGEFITLLGPSGCGKTTLLRMIAGFETPTEGSVLLDGVDVTHLPPYRRDVNQVFQSYALFPHMSVLENVGFGLRMKKLPKEEITRRVLRVVELVALGGMEDRRPSQLSGGQRQRVALARAIVCEPKVLLLDEPLAALDAKLRRAMQIELKRLQQRLGITFVFVTHDQEEALTMSDRIAVMNQGKIEQLGNVSAIYHQPRTTFVADFIGHANIVEGEITGRGGDRLTLKLDRGHEWVAAPGTAAPPGASRVLVSVRPEKIHIQKTPREGENVFTARVEDEVFKGPTDQLLLVTDLGLELMAVVANESFDQESFHRGDRVHCYIHPEDIVVVQ